VDVAFDLDMLSAEIEVYKLAEDAKKQATGLTNVATDDHFAIAPQFKVKGSSSSSGRGPAKNAEETKVAQVLAAPATPPPPQQAKFDEGAVAEGGDKGKGRGPLASAGSPEQEENAEKPAQKAAPLPKDEISDEKPALAAATTSNRNVTATTVVPKDEVGDGEPS